MSREHLLENFYMVKEASSSYYTPRQMTRGDIQFFPQFVKEREKAFEDLKRTSEYRGNDYFGTGGPGRHLGMSQSQYEKRQAQIQDEIYDRLSKSNPSTLGRRVTVSDGTKVGEDIDNLIKAYNQSVDPKTGKAGALTDFRYKNLQDEMKYRDPANVQKRRAQIKAEVKARNARARRQAEQSSQAKKERWTSENKARDQKRSRRWEAEDRRSERSFRREQERAQKRRESAAQRRASRYAREDARMNKRHQAELQRLQQEQDLLTQSRLRRKAERVKLEQLDMELDRVRKMRNTPITSSGGGGGARRAGMGIGSKIGIGVLGTGALLGGYNYLKNQNRQR